MEWGKNDWYKWNNVGQCVCSLAGFLLPFEMRKPKWRKKIKLVMGTPQFRKNLSNIPKRLPHSHGGGISDTFQHLFSRIHLIKSHEQLSKRKRAGAV